jgi:hypothetical protein
MTLDDAVWGSAKDDALLLALTSGATYDQAAVRTGVSPSTIDRRMRDPGFRDRLHRFRGEVLARAADELADAASERCSACGA